MGSFQKISEEMGSVSPGLRLSVKTWIANSGLQPFQRLGYLNDLLDFGRWVRRNKCRNIFKTRAEYYRYLHDEVLHGEAIDFLEFGVSKGASIRLWAELNSCEASRFIGFDSFEGLPEEWKSFSESVPKGAFGVGGVIPDIRDSRVSFIKGYFQESIQPFLRSFAAANRLVVHCDADLYASTLFVLVRLDPILKPGDLILFDEFSSVSNEYRAFRDYAASHLRKYRLVAACEPLYWRAAIEML